MTEDFEEKVWEEEGGLDPEVFESEPEPEPEPVIEETATTSEPGVKVKYNRPGSVTLDSGQTLVYNRWVEVTESEAEYLLSFNSPGNQRFVQSTT